MLTRIRTGYSFGVAVGQPKDIAKRLSETWDSKYLPITDRASPYGWFKWKEECEKLNKTPVFGVELEVSPDITEKRPVSDLWTFYPQGDIKELNKLISMAYKQFRYRPLLSIDQAIETSCFRIVGHRSNLEDIRDKCREKKIKKPYIGWSPSATKYYLRKGMDLGFDFVLSGDNVYPANTLEDKSLYQIICTGYDDRTRYKQGGLQTYPQHIMSHEEYGEYMDKRDPLFLTELQYMRGFSHDILEQASKCILQKADLPKYDSELSLEEKCFYRSKSLGVDLSDERYRSRLSHELNILEKKNFQDYFHIVSDITKYARDKMIVGPGRGSAAGSLVCYLLGITTVDPVKHNLSFERFIDIYREDLPDIDLDFPTTSRQQVIRQVKKIFGIRKAVQIGTVNFYKAKQSIRETCSALNIQPWDLGKIRRADNLKEALEKNPDVLEDFPEIRILKNIEDHPRHSGKHAGAVVLAKNEIMDIVPINLRERSSPVAMISKEPAENIGLLKIDILGLAELDVLKECMDLAGISFKLLNKVKLNYGPAYRLIANKKYTGIFQYNEPAVQGVASRINVRSFNDLCIITSVGRSGPLESGAADSWVRRRSGQEDVSYPHPLFEDILKETLGVIVYQEQLMRIMKEVGGMKMKHIMICRKAINKKDSSLIEKYRKEFLEGSIKNGLNKKLANDIYDELVFHGQYSFNKSHAVSYSLITYWCMVLKARYPLEFTAAALTHMRGINKDVLLNKQRTLLREAKDIGIDFVPVDMDISTDKWTIHNKKLIGPLDNLSGIGPKKVKSILHHRKQNKVLSPALIRAVSKGKPVLDSLYPVKENIERISNGDFTRLNIHTPCFNIFDIMDTNISTRDEICLIGFIDKIKVKYTDDDQKRFVLSVHDDFGKMYCTVSSYSYSKVNRVLNKYGMKNSSTRKQNLYAMKGKVYLTQDGSTKLMGVNAVRYLGASE